MRDRLQVRVAAIAVVVMVVTLAVVALVTWRLIQVAERADVDTTLLVELEAAQRALPEEIAAAAGIDGVSSPVELQRAARRFLTTNPGSERHLTAVDVGGERFVTQAGPEPLRALRDTETLPDGTSASVVSVSTAEGPVRVLSSPVVADDGTELGVVRVYGSLAEGRAAAGDALLSIALAGGAGLLVGGVLLFLAVGRALRPVADLAEASRGLGRGTHTRVPEPERMDEVGTLAHEFNDMVDRLERAETERGELLSAVSHELRTPLAVARGHLEMFQAFGPGDADAARETAAVLQRELLRLGRIVEDLTAVTRGDEVGDVQREPVFAPDVIEALSQRLAGLGLADVDLGEAPPVVLIGDEDRLAQTLLNLVLNARTHTPAGTAVRVRVDAPGAWVRFVVEDDGPGIDPDVLPRVFEPFVTTRPGGARRTSGLGLAVVLSLTEAQGGTVSIDPTWPGTRVVVRLAAAEAG
ncbi:sensor histidine kinase [Aquipuribacter sp. MA13-6]|uniref:sensor histidine kinase n=1 Tax=unclassified Aquipuribacter TaxID=2635084 RepID=UPI003EE8FEA3